MLHTVKQEAVAYLSRNSRACFSPLKKPQKFLCKVFAQQSSETKHNYPQIGKILACLYQVHPMEECSIVAVPTGMAGMWIVPTN